MFNNNNNLKRSVGDLERFAFDNFDNFDPEMYDAGAAEDPSFYMDDEESYDPEMYDLPNGYQGGKRTKKARLRQSPLAQLDIVIDNSSRTTATTVELFNVLRSNTLIQNLNYNPSNTFQPQTFDNTAGIIPINGLTGFSGTTPAIQGPSAAYTVMQYGYMLYWNKDGSLVYNERQQLDRQCIISCPQVPFRVLHEATRSNLLWIEKVRLVVPSATLTQIDEPFTVFKNTFLGGRKENQIAPRSEFKPNQFQSNIVDIPFKTAIDAETGISYRLQSQSKVTLSLFFRFMRGNEYMVHDGF